MGSTKTDEAVGLAELATKEGAQDEAALHNTMILRARIKGRFGEIEYLLNELIDQPTKDPGVQQESARRIRDTVFEIYAGARRLDSSKCDLEIAQLVLSRAELYGPGNLSLTGAEIEELDVALNELVKTLRMALAVAQ